jgi:hypothetical protein
VSRHRDPDAVVYIEGRGAFDVVRRALDTSRPHSSAASFLGLLARYARVAEILAGLEATGLGVPGAPVPLRAAARRAPLARAGTVPAARPPDGAGITRVPVEQVPARRLLSWQSRTEARSSARRAVPASSSATSGLHLWRIHDPTAS